MLQEQAKVLRWHRDQIAATCRPAKSIENRGLVHAGTRVLSEDITPHGLHEGQGAAGCWFLPQLGQPHGEPLPHNLEMQPPAPMSQEGQRSILNAS